MTYEKKGDTIHITLRRDFNLLTARKVRRLCRDVNEVHIDLSRSKFVDTEGIIVLYELIKAGKKVRLIHPPPIFFEVVHILRLEEIFRPEALVA
ncbi:STAS domain-containing protein [Rhodocaloribacter sp.]